VRDACCYTTSILLTIKGIIMPLDPGTEEELTNAYRKMMIRTDKMYNHPGDRSYRVYNFSLRGNAIFNYAVPPSAGCHYPDAEKRQISEDHYIEQFDKKNSNFYANLEQDVLKNGFRNPILITRGWAPDSAKKRIDQGFPDMDYENTMFCCTFGGSRLWVATKHKMLIPCIVVDYTNGPLISSRIDYVGDLYRLFNDMPGPIMFNDDSLRITPPKFSPTNYPLA